MTAPPTDQPARDRIASALAETLFVEAGAGTGKTTQLVGRVINLVVEAGIPLSSIAAITFTEAAAAELRDRIREHLERAIEDDDASELSRRRCRDALGEIDMAAISTLHAFAHRILREHPVAAGLPPQVDVLDEVRSQLEFERRWTEWLDELIDDPASEATVVRGHHLRVRMESRVPSAATLKELARVLGQNWDRLDSLIADAPEGEPPAPRTDDIRGAVAALRGLPPQRCSPGECTLVDHLAEIEPTLRALEVGTEAEVVALLGDRKASRVFRRVGNKQHCIDPQHHRDAMAEIDRVCDAEADRLVDDVMRRFGGLLATFTRDHAERRAFEGRLEFHDLLVLARRLLRTRPAARQALHDRYQRLLLDEFQDTDPIQIELAVLVAAVVAGEVDDWRSVDPEPGRLFFVGDAKQSIYRFRRADVGVFLDVRDRYAAGDAVELGANFRTVPPIIDWLNGLFAAVMHEEPGRRPGYAPLSAHRAADSGVDHRPVLFGTAHTELSAAEIREAEAADVADVLADIERRPASWPVFDRALDGGRWRPARLDDVAVLIPARTSLRHLERALRPRGVRYRVDTGTLVYDTQEVVELLAVLRVLDDPADGISMVAALRSPLFGCGDDDLATYRNRGGHWDLTRPVPDELTEHPVGRAVAWLADLHGQRWWREPSELLLTIIEQRRAFEVAVALDRPRDVWRRLRFLVDQARAFEESEGGDLRDFLAWAELQGHEASRVHEPVLPEADDRSARIMTIHGAKGLEFPITVVSGLSTQTGRARRGASVMWDTDGQAAIRLTKDTRTDNFDVIADFEAEMEEGERLRLLYVALTRARDHLVVSTHHKPTKNVHTWSHAQLVAETVAEAGTGHRDLAEALADDRAISTDVAAVPTDPAATFVGPATDGERDGWIATRSARLARATGPVAVSATAVAAGSLGDRSVGEGRDDEDLELDEDDDHAPFRRGRARTAIGRAVHAVLQDGDLHGGSDLDSMARAAASAEAVPWAAEEVSIRARSAARSAAVRAALAADRHWRELPVVAPVGTHTVEGYIDLLYQDGDDLVVVDYKTDELRGPADAEDKVARYRLQGATYAVALEQATGLTVRDCIFVFATEGEPIERSVDDLSGAMSEVRRLLDDGAEVQGSRP